MTRPAPTVRAVDAAGEVLRLQRATGMVPSYREICRTMGLAPNAVFELLQKAEAAGLVRHEGGRRRTLVVVACKCPAPATWRPVHTGVRQGIPRVSRDAVCISCRGVVLLRGSS